VTVSKHILAIMLLSGSFRPVGAALPKTRAEISEYRQTSSLRDVERFLEELQEQKHPISLEYIGNSHLGERIPMVICSRPLVTDPGSARELGRPVVYVQANIHGGEVEGKEAVQMILRDRLSESPSGVLDKIVLLAVPVFNIDGNEALGPQQTNRSRQNGPQQVGQRANGQGLDLNRDYVKLETPEVRGSLQHVFERWDPDVFIDLHATNGTIHGYQLTYSPPLNPNTEKGVLHFTRDELLPKVREILDRQHGLKTFDYGNLLRSGDESAWHTYDPDPRYATNYVGLRNRISILSEAMSYLFFKDRVTATYLFVNAILDQVASEGARIVELTRRADLQVTNWGKNPRTAPALGVRFERAQHGREGILLEKSDTPGRRPRGSAPTAPKQFVTEVMPVFDRFKPTRTARFPAAYVVGADLTRAVELLQLHGIEVRRLSSDWQGQTEVFVVERIERASRLYQGHTRLRLSGRFELRQSKLSSGDYIVSTAQPLGILIFQLLEPQSADGVATWNFLDPKLQPGRPYPVLKIHTLLTCPTEIVGN